jgi:hypothetical protein
MPFRLDVVETGEQWVVTRIDERRELYLQDVSLDAAVRELQLMALVQP